MDEKPKAPEGAKGTTAEEDAKAAATAAKEAAKDREPLALVGRAGGAFNINGEGFGASGMLTVGGVVIPTTRWNDTSIKGVLPATVKSGDIVVTSADGATQKGKWPTPKPEDKDKK